VEVFAVPLPKGLSPTRIVSAPDGRIAIAGNSGEVFLLFPDGEETRFDANVGDIAGVGFQGSAIQILGRSGASKVIPAPSSDRIGEPKTRTLNGTRGEIDYAVRATAGWFVTGVDSVSFQPVLSFLPDEPQGTESLLGIPFELPSPGGGTLALLQARQGLLVTQIQAPHLVVLLDQEGRTLLRFSPVMSLLREMTEGAAEGPEEPKWLSLSPVPLEGGYIQTFCDIKSDWRVFVQFDSTGSIASLRTLNAPLAIVAWSQTQDLLLAIRDVDGFELAGYRQDPGTGGVIPPSHIK
jgi:hypothetical protein